MLSFITKKKKKKEKRPKTAQYQALPDSSSQESLAPTQPLKYGTMSGSSTARESSRQPPPQPAAPPQQSNEWTKNPFCVSVCNYRIAVSTIENYLRNNNIQNFLVYSGRGPFNDDYTVYTDVNVKHLFTLERICKLRDHHLKNRRHSSSSEEV